MSDFVLQTRVGLPPLRQGAIDRGHLCAALPHQVLTLVAAPAGFGKSTLLTTWAHSQETPVAWLGLEPADNSLSRWMRYLVAAFAACGVDFSAPLDTLHDLVLHSPEDALQRFLNALDAHEDPPLLVLDDYHFIDNPEIHEAMCLLLEHWPQRGHIVLASRETPPFPLARWQVKARMASLHTDALRFGHEEAATFLQDTMGLTLAAAQCEALHAQTEGWAAGLQLAALAMHAQGAAQAAPAQLALSNDKVLVEYVEQEILAPQPEALREFMLATALLPRFNESLCAHMTGRDDSTQSLVDLEQTQLFLVRLSPGKDGRPWYRYHHLFAQILTGHLQHTHPALAQELHAKASHWFAEEGMWAEAIEHALKSQDWAQAADWLETYIQPLQAAGENWSIAQWLERLPPNWLEQRPQLGLAWVSAKATMRGSSDQIEPMLEALERGILSSIDEADGAEPNEEQVTLLAMLYRTRMELAWHLRDYEKALHYSERVQQILPPQWEAAHAHCKMLEGFICDFRAAPPDQVQALFRASSEQATRSNPRQWSPYIFSTWGAAWVDLETGQPHRAARACQGLLDEVTRQPLAEAPPAFMLAAVYAMQAHLALEWDRKDEALEAAKAAMQRLHRNLSWEVHHYIKTIWAYAQYANDDLDAAEETLLQTVRGFSFLSPRDSIYASLVPFRLRRGDIDGALQWAERCAFSLDEAFAKDWLLSYTAYIGVLMAVGQHEQAHAWIDALSTYAKSIGRSRYLLDLTLCKAVLLAAQDDIPAALDHLEDAITQATPGGYIRPFLEQSSLVAPLFAQLPTTHDPKATMAAIAYRRKLQTALTPGAPQPKATSEAPEIDPLDEVLLSRRESEILAEVANGLTNREIAAKLHISAETVKSHMKNIFFKLEVKNRTQAVAQARRRQLLPGT